MIPWNELIARAEQVCRPRFLSSSSEAGAVAAAILTDRGNCYTGTTTTIWRRSDSTTGRLRSMSCFRSAGNRGRIDG